MKKTDEQSFRQHDSILVKYGSYNGWVGYFQRLVEDDPYTAEVLLMDGDGSGDINYIPIDYLMNLEQFCKSQMHNI